MMNELSIRSVQINDGETYEGEGEFQFDPEALEAVFTTSDRKLKSLLEDEIHRGDNQVKYRIIGETKFFEGMLMIYSCNSHSSVSGDYTEARFKMV